MRDRNALKQKLRMWENCGLSYYQLRAKSMSALDYLRLAEKLRSLTPQMRLLANDFAKTALSHPDLFCGLHLGQEDLLGLSRADPKTRQRLYDLSHGSSNFVLGLSTHRPKEIRLALRAQDAIAWDYIALGPCFTTSSKKKTQKKSNKTLAEPLASSIPAIPLGEFTEALKVLLSLKEENTLKAKHSPQTLVLIGGIRSKNIDDLFHRPIMPKIKRSFSIVLSVIKAAENQEEITFLLKFLSRALGKTSLA